MASKSETNNIEHAPSAAIEDADIKKTTRDFDDALKFAVESESITWTEAEEKKVLWKIDAVILTLVSSSVASLEFYMEMYDLNTNLSCSSQLFLGAIVSYADTQAYGFAALFGLVNDLKLFVLKAVGGKPVIDTTKYQLSAGMSPLGAAAVSISPLNPLYYVGLILYRVNIHYYSSRSSSQPVDSMAWSLRTSD